MMEVLGLYAHQASAGKNFKWTSLTVNTGFASSRHRDAGNAGPSMIQAFGAFDGGELLVWEEDNLRQTIAGHQDEDAIKHDVRQVTFFDGRRLHSTVPFRGERTSIIWYTSRHLS